MHPNDSISRLFAISSCLFMSFLFSVVSVASDGWSVGIPASLVTFYNADPDNLLWVVGCVVFLILGIICLCLSAIIVISRFFNHGQGRAMLGGILSAFAGIVFLVALIIFMVQVPAIGPTYGYSFAFAWIAIPFAVVAAVLFFLLEDTKFLM